VKYKVCLFAVQILRGKQSFERIIREHGVIDHTYLAAHEIFKANPFVHQINSTNSRLRSLANDHILKNGMKSEHWKTIPHDKLPTLSSLTGLLTQEASEVFTEGRDEFYKHDSGSTIRVLLN